MKFMNTTEVIVDILLLAFLLGIIQLFSCRSLADLSCNDETGKNVDWFVIYKLPKLDRSTNPLVAEGRAWAYFGPNSEEWQLSKLPINNLNSTVGVTISPLFHQNQSSPLPLSYLLYNDQPPQKPAVANNGHTKGIIITNSNQGIWIIHSIPHFPYTLAEPTNFYPSTGFTNGQLFMCLTMKTSQIDSVGEIFKYTRPNIFDYSIPETMEAQLPTLTAVAKKGERVKAAPWFKLFQLNVGRNGVNGGGGEEGVQFQIFAKGPKSKQEIYSEWIAPKLQTSLNVQSWLNGPNPLTSNCQSNYSTHNILLKAVDGQTFSTHQDHSKWAVGTELTNTWTCLADLNRMEHQLSRGGASLCTPSARFWKLFSKLATEIQPCPHLLRAET